MFSRIPASALGLTFLGIEHVNMPGNENKRFSPTQFLCHYFRALNVIWNCDPKGTSIFLTGTVILALAVPAELWLSKCVIDEIANAVTTRMFEQGAVLRHVATLLAAQVLITLFAAMVRRSLNLLQNIQGMKLNHHIRLLGLKKASNLDVAFFESPSFHDMYDRAIDRPAGDAHAILLHLSFVTGAATTLVSMLLLLQQLHILAVPCIVAVSLPFVWSRARFTARRFSMRWHQTPKLRMVNYLAKLLGSRETAMEMRLYALHQPFLKRLQVMWQRFISEDAVLSITEQRTQFFLDIPVALVVAGISFYAMRQALSGAITVGTMVLYVRASKSATENLDGLFSVGSALYSAGLSLRDLFAFLDMKPSAVEGALRPAPRQPLPITHELEHRLEFCNVSFRYPGSDRWVLQNVSFTLAPGERVAIVGANGAGKTTIVRLLTRLYDPNDGFILLNGHRLEDYDLEELRKQYGVLFQDFVKYNFSVRENIGFGNFESIDNNARLQQAAQDAGCLATIQRLPRGFDTILGRSLAEGVDISGGEWQKLALARAFMRNGRILILDEPSGSLDAFAEAQLNSDVEQLMKDRTCIMISHRLSMVRSMNRILVLQQGRLIQQGTHAELMAQEGLYSRMYNLQAARYRDADDAVIKAWTEDASSVLK